MSGKYYHCAKNSYYDIIITVITDFPINLNIYTYYTSGPLRQSGQSVNENRSGGEKIILANRPLNNIYSYF